MWGGWRHTCWALVGAPQRRAPRLHGFCISHHRLPLGGLPLGLLAPAARNPWNVGAGRTWALRQGFISVESCPLALRLWGLVIVPGSSQKDVLLGDSSLKTEGLAGSQKDGVRDASGPLLAPPRGAPQPGGWTQTLVPDPRPPPPRHCCRHPVLTPQALRVPED